MVNRFTRKIKSGEIDTEEQLKSEFKALAKELHPDIAGEGFHAEFVRVRQEYESALGDFGRHRFGAGREKTAYSAKYAAAGPVNLFDEMLLLLKRGFPKNARHEKERLRYLYAVWRFRNAVAVLGSDMPARFDAFHHELLALKSHDKNALHKIILILRDLVEYERKPLSPLLTTIEIEYEAIRLGHVLGLEAQSFLGRLIRELGEGNVINRH